MLALGVAPGFLKGAGRMWKKSGVLWLKNAQFYTAPLEIGFLPGPRGIVPILWRRIVDINTGEEIRPNDLPSGVSSCIPPMRVNADGEVIDPYLKVQ